MSKEDYIRATTSLAYSSDQPEQEQWMELNLKFRLDEVARAEIEQLRAAPRREPVRSELVKLARRIYDSRRARNRVFDGKLFGEPAWDMLLALYCFPAVGEVLTVTGLSYAACTAPTTGHRWQAQLTKHRLIERGPKGPDGRMQFVRLTDAGRELIEKYLTRLYHVEAAPPPSPLPDQL